MKPIHFSLPPVRERRHRALFDQDLVFGSGVIVLSLLNELIDYLRDRAVYNSEDSK